MVKYTLISTDGQKIRNCLDYSDAIAKAVFDSSVNEDDLSVMEDCFATSHGLTKAELKNTNLQLATFDVEAIMQN